MSIPRPEILVVDDERAVRVALCRLLEERGFAVRAALGSEAAFVAVTSRRPDLILLDVMMPGQDGYACCARLRSHCAGTPVVFLTAKDTPEDEIRGLACGGDDFVSKTAPVEILLARIDAALRRNGGARGATAAFAFSQWTVRPDAGRLDAPDGSSAPLQPAEEAALRRMAERPGCPVSRTELSALLCGSEAAGAALDTAMSRLRAKFGAAAPIVTVRGRGYALAAE